MKALTERDAAVLTYVVEHSGCTTKDVACFFKCHVQTARTTLDALTGLWLLGRQEGSWSEPYRWHPTADGLAVNAGGRG